MKNHYNHKYTRGFKYERSFDEILRNQVTNIISKKSIAKCRISGVISKITYHRLNLGTDGQGACNFRTVKKIKTTQLTIVIPFKKLDVIVESKKGNNSLMNNNNKMSIVILSQGVVSL